MARLPIPGSDTGTWGQVLNDYLAVSHNGDGTLKANVVDTNAMQDAAVTQSKLSSGAGNAGQVLGSDGSGLVWTTPASGSGDATTSAKGVVQLAGDLAGTAAAPTVPGLAGKANTSHTHTIADVTNLQTALNAKEPTITAGTTSQYYRGDKTFQTLDKTAVGLANVDNTADANKPVSTAVQTALNAKANTSSLATVATSGAYADLTGKPTIPAQFNPIAGTNVNLSGTYPNITFNATPGSGSTDITSTRTATTVTVESSTGADATLVSADASNAGILTAADKSKLDGIASGAQVNTVTSVAGKTGAVTLVKADVGLGNVDNTSDINKPISTATQTALNAKEATITAGTTAQYYRGDKTFQTLDKTAVGLSNVDNTSDANKPISTSVQTALNAKEPTITAGTSTQYYRGDKTFQTLDKTALGLGNVDNTSDVNKPISTATQTALNAKADTLSTINAQTGTSYTLDVSDVNKFITLTNSSTVTVTVPANASAAFAVGTRIMFAQMGSGQVVFVAAGGVSLYADPGLKIAVQYGGAELVKLATDTWILVGRLAA